MKIVFTMTALVVGAVALVRWLERRVVFVPSRSWGDRTPESAGSGAREICLRARDGVRISALWIPREEPRGTIVYCHGNAGNLSHRIVMAQDWVSLGYSVLLFDYRGYGRSEGRPSEAGLHLDSRAAYEEARRLAGEEPILFGRSLGTVPAIRLATEVPARGLVIDSPLLSARHMAFQVIPLPGIHWFVSLQLDNERMIPRIGCPLLILHGDSDEIIPFDHGRRLFDLAPSPKQFLPLLGLSHNDERSRPGIRAALQAFLDGLPRT